MFFNMLTLYRASRERTIRLWSETLTGRLFRMPNRVQIHKPAMARGFSREHDSRTDEVYPGRHNSKGVGKNVLAVNACSDFMKVHHYIRRLGGLSRFMVMVDLVFPKPDG
jgi:hypothetical protein